MEHACCLCSCMLLRGGQRSQGNRGHQQQSCWRNSGSHHTGSHRGCVRAVWRRGGLLCESQRDGESGRVRMSKTKEGENTSTHNTHNTHNTPHSTHNTHNTHTRDLVLALLIALEEPKMIRFDFLIACLIDELQRLLAWRKNHEWCGKSSLVCFCGVVDRENRCFLVNVFHQSSCACHEGEKHTHKHKHKHKHKTTKHKTTKPNQTKPNHDERQGGEAFACGGGAAPGKLDGVA